VSVAIGGLLLPQIPNVVAPRGMNVRLFSAALVMAGCAAIG
jgi:hypothetical protein